MRQKKKKKKDQDPQKEEDAPSSSSPEEEGVGIETGRGSQVGRGLYQTNIFS